MIFKKLNLHLLLFILMIGISNSLRSTELSQPDDVSLLNEIIGKYQSSGLVELSVDKVISSELMGTETKYSGKISLSSGLFRWQSETPEKALLIYDGKFLWNIQFPPAEFRGEVQITKSKVDNKNKQQFFLASLLNKKNFKKKFKMVVKEDSEKIQKVNLDPLEQEVNVRKISILIDKNSKTISEIVYFDDVENKTQMKFKETLFNKEKNHSLFQYKPEKGAQVINL